MSQPHFPAFTPKATPSPWSLFTLWTPRKCDSGEEEAKTAFTATDTATVASDRVRKGTVAPAWRTPFQMSRMGYLRLFGDPKSPVTQTERMMDGQPHE